MENKNHLIIHIAIADGDAVTRGEIAHLIGSFGGFVIDIITESGKELIRRICKMKTLPGICLFEIRLRDKNGYETLIEIKKRWPEMYALIFTSVSHKCAVRYMLEKGADGYLHKDIHFNDLEKALRAVYEKGFYHTELTSGIIMHAIHGDKNYVPHITDTETKFLSFCCKEYAYKAIAGKMGVSESAVHKYRESLFEKLNIVSKSGLSASAIEMGFTRD